jgi:hypothetical protein
MYTKILINPVNVSCHRLMVYLISRSQGPCHLSTSISPQKPGWINVTPVRLSLSLSGSLKPCYPLWFDYPTFSGVVQISGSGECKYIIRVITFNIPVMRTLRIFLCTFQGLERSRVISCFFLPVSLVLFLIEPTYPSSLCYFVFGFHIEVKKTVFLAFVGISGHL